MEWKWKKRNKTTFFGGEFKTRGHILNLFFTIIILQLKQDIDITPNTTVPPGANLPRREWVSLNRIRTGVGRFNAAMHRWGLRPSAACQCGAPEQTAQHILSECPDLRPPDNVDLTHPTPGTVTWLEHLRDVT